MFAAADPSVSVQSALLIAGAGGLVGSLVGGFVTWRVASAQLRADSRRQWRVVAADAYALTLAVASEFNFVTAQTAALYHAEEGGLPDWYGDARSDGASALGALERASALSDDPRVHEATKELSMLLRHADFSWRQMIGSFIQQQDHRPNTSIYKNLAEMQRNHGLRLDEYLASIYGVGGDGGGWLDRLRDAIRDPGETRLSRVKRRLRLRRSSSPAERLSR